MINLKEFKVLFHLLSNLTFQGIFQQIQFEMPQKEYSDGEPNMHNQYVSFLNLNQYFLIKENFLYFAILST